MTNQPINPIKPEEKVTPEGAPVVQAPEQAVAQPEVSAPPTPEVTIPTTPEANVSAPEVDHLSAVTQPPVTDDLKQVVPSDQTADDATLATQAPIAEVGEGGVLDEQFIDAAEKVAEDYQEKPFEEEEEAEKLSISYLLKRFGKKIRKE